MYVNTVLSRAFDKAVWTKPFGLAGQSLIGYWIRTVFRVGVMRL